MADEKQMDDLIREITQLEGSPEIINFLREKLAEAKNRFKDKIKPEAGSAVQTQEPSLTKPDGDTSYFFELNRSETKTHDLPPQWEAGAFEIGNRPDLIRDIQERFIPRINDFPVAPSLFQTETIRSSQPNTALEINFMKSESRLVGYAREVKKMEPIIEHKTGNVIKVSTAFQNVDREEMNRRIISLMDENEDAREDIYLYYYMHIKSKTPKVKD